jgi:tRNA(fMet)-specific endonuclease VapC
MMSQTYVLFDTNILIELVKATDKFNDLKKLVNPHNANVVISIVTVAEVRAFASKNSWGQRRLEELEKLMADYAVISIDDSIIERYVEIEAYNWRKSDMYPKIDGNAVKMGKNDIWIAATALLMDIPIITTDKDFDHLNGVMIDVVYIQRDANGKVIV